MRGACQDQSRLKCSYLLMVIAVGGAVGFWAGTARFTRAESGVGSMTRRNATTAAATTTQATTQKTPEQRKAEEIVRVMEFFRITQPDTYEQAKTLRDTNPAVFYKMIHDASSKVNHLEQMKKKNPALFELWMRDFELTYNTIHQAKEIEKIINPSERGAPMRKLADMVGEQFDVRQKIRQIEIDELRKQLSDLEDELKNRSDDKEALIKKRADDLLSPSPPNQW